MMRITPWRTVVGGLLVALGGADYLPAARVRASQSLATAPVVAQTKTAGTEGPITPRAVFDRYCVTCHNQRLKTAGLALDTLSVDRATDAAAWEKVARKLRTGTMPPVGRPRPDQATYDAVAASLEAALDRAAASRPDPGRPAIHRLNRTEYTNVIRDLLALEIDARALLPADDSAYGFDNNADILTVSPGLVERYMSAAQKISRLAIGDTTLRPAVESYEIARHLVQDERISEELPFGTRGGIAIRHHFPLDGQYVVRVHLQRRRSRDQQQLEVLVDGGRIRSFTIGNEASAPRPEDLNGQAPTDGGLEVHVPVKAGSHTVGVTLVQRTAALEGMAPAQLPVGSFTYAGKRGVETAVERVEIAGPYDAQIPDDTPSRRRIFVCHPASGVNGYPRGSSERRGAGPEGPGKPREPREPRGVQESSRGRDDACAKRILTTLARRAYRRPVTERDLQKLLGFYRADQDKGGFDAGIQSALERILVDPQFLFRIEQDPAKAPPATAYRLSDVEIASRLSFFLWSSMPDDELLDLAARGRLSAPSAIEQQVTRMLADPRASTLVSNFATQWLHLQNVQTVTPDVTAFPGFDDNLRQAFQRETELFLESQLREDRSVVDLLGANYTFINERLARHYGIPNIYGSHFRRVTLSDGKRAGLLGQGSILTVTSYANRTSPVVRGKWLLENIIGAPPPAPPPNVPQLPDLGAEGKPASVRDRMEQHRRNPACASCHAQMDPLGFALENFDAIGWWRTTTEANTPIDASGTLPDGAKFEGPAELRALLLERRDSFVMTVIGKLLTYALGRGVEHYDMPAIRKIMREAASSDYRWSSLIVGIARSTPFQMRRSES